jgi:hypothetical protein
VQNPLALAVLEGRFLEGDRITADVGSDGQLVFTKLPGQPEDEPSSGAEIDTRAAPAGKA